VTEPFFTHTYKGPGYPVIDDQPTTPPVTLSGSFHIQVDLSASGVIVEGEGKKRYLIPGRLRALLKRAA
jgi:hypothetical protein